MNPFFFAAGVLVVLLVFAHSLIGEQLIFRHLRRGASEHDRVHDLLPARRWNALWGTWHLLSLLGLGLGTILIALAMSPARDQATVLILAVTFAVSGVFWLAATRGRHPAWVVLLAVAALIWTGS